MGGGESRAASEQPEGGERRIGATTSEQPEVTETRRIVMLGKTGSGKSSLANTIFGESVFTVGHTSSSETKERRAETRSVNGRNITLIDTPGFFDTDRPEEEMKTDIVRCLTDFAPGPHVFLIVVKVEKFSENDIFKKICKYFSEEALKYAAVVFTHGDQLPEGKTIRDFVKDNEGLSDLVEKCSGRFLVIDNKCWNCNQLDEYRSNQFQVAELLNTLDKIYNPYRRIVLLGKTGAGKSSIANTIFGEEVFETDDSANSRTSKCTKKTRSVNEKNITLVDTPGFIDTDKSKKNLLREEIVNCITECTPGPHAFLILLKVEKFTKQEKKVIKKIQETFSKEAFKYAAVVFTHGDQLPEGKKIEYFVENNEGLKDLVKKCSNRYHVIDNKYWKINQQDEYRSNQFQVMELLNTIDNMAEEGSCYTNEMLKTVDRLIRKYGKIYVSDFLKNSFRITTRALLGALLGVPIMISSVVKALKKMKPPPAAVVVAKVAVGAAKMPGLGIAAGVEAAMAAAAGAAGGAGLGIAAGVAAGAGAVMGGCIGVCEAEKADSVGEAAMNVANNLFERLKITKNNEK